MNQIRKCEIIRYIIAGILKNFRTDLETLNTEFLQYWFFTSALSHNDGPLKRSVQLLELYQQALLNNGQFTNKTLPIRVTMDFDVKVILVYFSGL